MFRGLIALSIWCVALALPGIAGAQAVRDSNVAPSSTVRGDVTTVSSQPSRGDAVDVSPASGLDREACFDEAELREQEPETSDWRWRRRAYRYLDCVLALADEALGGHAAEERSARAGDAEGHPVAVSRQQLEDIRTLAWWARDAAARIGR